MSTPYLWERFRGGSHYSIFTRFGSFSEGGELGTWSKFQNENPISSASPVKILLREDFQIDLGYSSGRTQQALLQSTTMLIVKMCSAFVPS